MKTRYLRAFALLCAVSTSVIASAATTEFRVFIDSDNSTATGCPVAASLSLVIPGIDHVLITTVDTTTNTVTKVERQQCTGGVLGGRILVDPAGWSAGASADGSKFLVESYIPTSVFGSALPSLMRLDFIAGTGALASVITTNANGKPVMFPPVVGKRHSVETGSGTPRTIVLDGDDHDWAGVTPLVSGAASFGTSAIKYTDISLFPTSSRLFFLFRVKNETGTGAAPIANNDVYSVIQGHTLAVVAPGVLANDTDPGAHTLTAAALTQPSEGTLSLSSDGGFTYVNGGGLSPDSFQYKANNGTTDSNPATVTINIFPDTPPVAVADAYSVAHGGTLNVPAPGVLANDTDALGDPITALLATPPSHGTLTLNANGSLKYIHDGSNTLTDTFTYRATDGIVPSAPATVTITIGPDAPPVAVADSYTVLEGGTLTIAAPGVLANDTDVDTPLNMLTANLVSGPTHGSLTLNPNGSFTYTNDNLTAAADSFTYRANDGILNSAPATVSISVTPVNHAPKFTAGAAIVSAVDTAGAQSIPWATGINAGAADESGQTLNFIVSNDNNALFSVQPSIAVNGTLSFTPVATAQGIANVTVRLHDNGGTANGGVDTSAAVMFEIDILKAPTITSGNSANFQAGTPSTFTVTTTGFLPPAITETGALPSGITLVDHHDNTASLGGNAAQGSGGVYPITIKATNLAGMATQSFTITVCNIIAITNPSTTSGPAGVAFSQTFTQTGAVGGATFTTTSTLPAGLSLSTGGVLSGTPTQTGTFPIVVKVTDVNNCTGTGATYTLVINCPTITVTNPATTTGTAGTAFSQTFTQSGAVGGATFTTASTLPAGLSLSTGGVLSGTPTQTGTFPIVVKVTDANNCTGTGATYTLVIGCQTINVTNPATTTGTAGSPFSQTFTQTGAIGTATFTTSSSLPTGLSLSTAGVLSGTPTVVGSFPIVVKVTDSNGCQGTGATYTLVIGCQTITVTNPATTTGTASTAFSQTFTQSGAIGGATFTTASTLPTGLSLSTAGVLSGTPTQTGSFPIVVTVTDGNGCTGTGATYTLVIGCQVITVTNPNNNTGTVSSPFSEQFTQSGAIGTATFTTASTLPNGLTLSTSGLLSGTPTQNGTFPIVVTVTDSNSCTGTSATYNLTINCQTITVTNPVTNSVNAGSPFSVTFTQSGAVGGASFTTASTLPTGLTLHAATGVLDGTPTQGGTFPIVVTVTDGNGCTGTGATYTLTVNCPTITVTNPVVSTGTAGTAFSQQFTQSGGIGTITWSEVGTLPTGFSLNTSNGVLSGNTNQVGTFPITATATDQNGCQGSGALYNLTINCQTISITNPGVNTGTVDASFSQTFTATGILGTATWSETGALPAGITLNSASGNLGGTPTVNGSFPITVKVTDTNGCFATSSYTLTINCQTITVTKPVVTTGTVDASFSQTFTQTGAHGTATFTTASTLPAGLSLSTAGVLSGTPTVKGTFPIVVTVTDSNGCTGTSTTYNLVINCQTITVTNPGVNSGTTNQAFSQQFTQSGAHGSATFTTASTLPTGFSLSTSGLLSGTTLQHGTFPIVVTVTDSNGCTGSGATYTLTINCQTITVTNPVNTSGTVNAAFSEQFSQSGALGGATFTTASTLPNGLSLSTSGLLSGTPTQSGTFPIVVTVTDGGGCTGTGATYTLVIACNVITVTNPATNTGTAGTLFNQQFTQSGGTGTVTWSETGALPSGITLNTSTGFLTGTTSQTGSFPITVTATDSNGCQGTGSTYTLTINCQTITITNPAQTSVQAGATINATFTATGILGSATWTETGSLPSGITLSSAGVLSGSTNSTGTYPITVKVTDTNGCFATSSYTLTVTCPTITVTRTGGGSFPAATFNVGYPAGNTFTATCTGCGPTFHWAFPNGGQPPGINLTIVAASLSGIPSATGTFNMTPIVTDTSTGCTGTATFPFTILPNLQADTYNNLVNNTEAVVTGGTTTSPATAFVTLSSTLVSNDTPAAGVTATAGTFSTTQGGSVTIAADGTFKYTPPVTAAALSSDTFTYTGVSNTGTVPSFPQYAASTGSSSTTQTVTLNLANRVWYVKNNGSNGNGQSQSPFNSLTNFTNAARVTPDAASDIIFVYNGDGTTTNQNAGIKLLSGEQLIGEGVALVVNSNTLTSAGTKPQITNATAASDAVTLNDGNTIKGVTITGATRDGISSVVAHAGFTADTITVQNNTNVGVNLISMTGTVGITNSTISTVGNQALTINNGTAAVTADNTNTINGGTGTAVEVLNRPGSAGAINIGATLNNGQIQLLSNASGTISFTGSQTLSNGTVNGITMNTNAGATVNFSGTLNVTTTTGIPFQASGGGTLNVSGTANLTSGAAANGLSLNGMTIGGTGVAFSSINTTGATTGISLVNDTGTVSVNGGTISNGTTGINLQGSSTNLSLAGVTITGPTTGITNTTNFGTLTIGSSVNVSAATALNLTSGAVSGTFANVTSTGGTNGVNLNAVTGTWGATAGSLTGASGATFNVTGGSGGTITWGPSISQSNGANVVTIAGGNSNTINFGGNVTSSGTSTGLSISASSGTYNFNGTNAFSGSGNTVGAIDIANGESGTVTFSNATTNTASGTGANFQVDGSVSPVTAAITYSGTISRSGAVGRIVDVNKLNTPGSLTMSHAPAAAGNLTGSFNGAPTTASGISIINSSSTNISVSNASLTYKNIDAVTLSGNTGATITLNGLSIVTNGSGKGVLMSGAGTVNIGSGAAAPVINMSAGSNAGIDGTTVAFTGTLNLSNAAITGNGVTAVTLGGGTLGGTGSTITNAGPALVLSGVALTNGAGMNSITSSGGVNGISLTTVTGGTYTISGGSLSGNTSTAFLMTNGSPSVTYAGTISSAVAGGPVSMSGVAGGTMTFSGAVSSTSGGVSITTNGATVTFTGGLSLSTGAATAFTATGGGTVTATQNNTSIVNTLTTTTGTALNVATTQIGAANLTFRSITAGTGASGPGSGIILNNTGSSGGLVVTGNSGAGTGGTMQKMTGAGISLTSTKNVSLSFMIVQNGSMEGILGSSVDGFTLISSSVTGNSTAGNNRDGIKLTDTVNAVTFTSDTVTGNFNSNVQLTTSPSSTAVMTTLTVTGGTFSNSTQNVGFLVDLHGSAALNTASVSGATFSGNFSKGIQFQHNDNCTMGNGVGAPATGTITVNNNTITNNDVGASFESGGTNGNGSAYYRFTNNATITGNHSLAVNFANGSTVGTGTFKVFCDNNHIGTAGVPNSGSAIGEGIRGFFQGNQTVTATITNNVIRALYNGPGGFDARGIDIEELGYSGSNQGQTRLDVKLTGNDVDQQYTGSNFNVQYAIYVASDGQGTGTSGSNVNAEIHGNTVPTQSACDSSPCDGTNDSMIWYETVNASGTRVAALYNLFSDASVNAAIINRNTGTAGKTIATQNVPAVTLTATPPNTVN
jgi:VCBS repeat-containing protein